MSSRAVRLLSLFLIFALPTSLLSAETHAAMVFATGMASLNGSALARSTALFSGDVLETSKNSGIVINANGSTIQMGANSRLQFKGEAIGVDSGAAQVTTNSGMRVQVDALTVAPVDRAAKYQVTRTSGKVLVAALSGSVSVLNGKTSDVLTAGEAKTYGDGQDDKDKKNRDKGAVVYTSDKALFLWSAGALAAGGTLAYLFLRDGRKPLSNQLP